MISRPTSARLEEPVAHLEEPSMSLTRRTLLMTVSAFGVLGLVSTVAMAADLPPLAKKDSYKVGFAQTESNNPWRIAQTESMKAEAAKLGYQFVYTDAAGSAAKQVADVNSMIAQGVDLIFLAPREEKPLIPAVLAAKKAGIPVILLDRSVDPKLAVAGKDYVTFIGSDFVEEGKRVAEWLVKNANGKTKIIELEGTTGSSPANDRKKGFDEAIKAAGGFEIVASQSVISRATRGARLRRRCYRRIPTPMSSMPTMTRWRSERSQRSKPRARSRAPMCWCSPSTVARKPSRQLPMARSALSSNATRASARSPMRH